MRLPGIATEHISDTDDYWTPPAIIASLGVERFDLDPASPPDGVPWIPATNRYTQQDDGLLQPWRGLVWLNPPYSSPGPWIQRLADHSNGIALLPVDTSTIWWHEQLLRADTLCFLKGRPRFVRPGSDDTLPARWAVVLAGFGDGAAPVRRCGLGWVVEL